MPAFFLFPSIVTPVSDLELNQAVFSDSTLEKMGANYVAASDHTPKLVKKGSDSTCLK